MARRGASLFLACLLTLGCVDARLGGIGASPSGPRPGPNATPKGGPQAAELISKARLTGKVKLISANGSGIVAGSDGTRSLGSGVISNNGGAIISDNGGGLISNNGGSLVSKTKYGLTQAGQAQAGKPQAFLLADAVVALTDAAGKPVLGADGKPVTATTDRQGNYAIDAELPRAGLVLVVKLWNGGVLRAMRARDAAEGTLDIDTSSTLGATYVLRRFVKGDQTTFDKLPAAEAARLKRDLDAAGALVTEAPRYEEAELEALAEGIRARDRAVAQALADIKALLLGQANLGGGRQATTVALREPRGLVPGPDGELVMVEPHLGRIRRVAPDGAIETLADAQFGTRLKQNFATTRDMARGPDGALYVAMEGTARVVRIPATGEPTVVAGSGQKPRGPAEGPATLAAIAPFSLAFGPDGTLWIGEGALQDDPADARPARLLRLAPDGTLSQAPIGAEWSAGAITAIAVRPDGAVWLLVAGADAMGSLVRWQPGAPAAEVVLDGLAIDRMGDLALGADGTLYVAETYASKVHALAPDGKRSVVAGAGGPAATRGLEAPAALAVAADGRLLVGDRAANRVFALGADGGWEAVAGAASAIQADGGMTSLALNAPLGVAVDDQGGLLLAENGGHAIVRFDGNAITPFAGGAQGFAGDGGPARAARLNSPAGLAWHQGQLYVLDGGNRCLRRIGADGTIATLVGEGGKILPPTPLRPGETLDARKADLGESCGLAVAPDGTPHWAAGAGQLHRLRPDGRVELVAGAAQPAGAPVGFLMESADGPAADARLGFATGLAFDADGALLVADAGGSRVRRITGLAGASPTIAAFAGLSPGDLLGRLADATAGEASRKALEAGLAIPTALAFDRAGTMYVAELGTISLGVLGPVLGVDLGGLAAALPRVAARVRKIAPDGTTTIVAGPGGRWFPDPTAPDGLVAPMGLAVDRQGRLVIVDTGANQVRILPAEGP